jgi:hypothetical protein
LAISSVHFADILSESTLFETKSSNR